jgi:hypothetical protein
VIGNCLSPITYYLSPITSLMILAPESHKRIEAFLRAHLQDERLKLPPVFIYSGRMARWLTGRLQILAITFGRRIIVASKVVVRDEQGRLTVPAGLIAHEATHVIQYQEAGIVRFLFSYLREYWRALQEHRQGWSKAARNAAYFAIKHEREAYEAESAYATWVALAKMAEEKAASSSLPHLKEDSEPEL